MMKSKTTVDPIFAEYAKTAPRKDLEFYMVAAGRPRAAADFGPETPAAICQMAATYAEICGPKPGTTASQKRRAWQAIDRFKGSRVNDYGIACRARSFEPDLIRVSDILDVQDAAPGESLPAFLDRYAAANIGDPWWPTSLDGAEIVRLALAAALRADAAADPRGMEPLIEPANVSD